MFQQKNQLGLICVVMAIDFKIQFEPLTWSRE